MHVNFDKYSSKRHPNFAAISFVGVFFLVLFYVYLPMLGGGPVLDDLKQYHGVQKFQTIWECFGRDIHGWFRPFKNLAFYCTLSADGSFVYTKLACFAIFTANLLLLRKLFSLLGFSFYWAWGGAMVWALNPTMVSTVQFMSASNNQLCLSFLLLYLIAGLHYCDPGSPSKSLRARASFGAAILFLGLSMFSYEAGVSAPGILLVLVLLQYGWRGLFRSRAVMLVSASILTLAAYLIMRKLTGADTTFVSPNIPVGVEKLDLILRAPYYLWQHLLLWSSPWGRGGALIDHDPRGSVVLGVIGWLLILILLPGLLALISTRLRGVSAGLLIYLGSMVPLANVLGLGNGPICNYYLLIPSIGLAIALVSLMRELSVTHYLAIRLIVVTFVLAMGLWAIETKVRVVAWNGKESLARFSLSNYPDSQRNMALVSDSLFAAGKTNEALSLLKRAAELAPWSSQLSISIANHLVAVGRMDEAIVELESFVERADIFYWTAKVRLAELYVQEGQYHHALEISNDCLLRGDVPHFLQCRFYLNVAVPVFFVYKQYPQVEQLLNAFAEMGCDHDVCMQNLEHFCSMLIDLSER